MNEKKRVRSLLRVSSRQQLYDDDIPIQRAEIANYISGQPGWVFDCEYIEKAVSAFKNTVQEREVLLQILEDARKKKFDILLTFMSDRIGRKEEYNMYIAALNKLGIEVWTIKEGELKSQDDTDRLMLYIKFWGNERESRKTGERVKAAQIEMVKQGRSVGGYAPYGYELIYSGEMSNHGRSLKKRRIVESQAEVIREIFRLSIEENLGSFAIARRLNEQGIPSINGSEWKACTVSDRLKNPCYMGYITYNRRSHKEAYSKNPKEEWIFSKKPQEDLQIVTPEVWHRAQEMRELRKSGITGRKEKQTVASAGNLPLMGLLYCAHCNTKLTNGNRYDQWILKDGTKVQKICRRYKCTQKANASLKCKGMAFYKADDIEKVIFEEVCKYMVNLKQRSVYSDIIKNQESIQKKILKELESIRREFEGIKSDIKTLEGQIPQALRGEGLFSAEKLSVILKEKELKKETIQKHLKSKQQAYESTLITNKADFSELLPDWKSEFMEADTNIKKLLLFKLIERIEVGREDIRIIFKVREAAFQTSYQKEMCDMAVGGEKKERKRDESREIQKPVFTGSPGVSEQRL